MADQLAFSVVVTILNEVKTIEPLLHSLVKQALPPKEIIMVDAGSTDGTIEKIKDYQMEYREIRLIVAAGLNRSEGRNRGIAAATHPYIAITDAGCVADNNWLLELRRGFEEKGESVAGFYRAVTKNSLQKVCSWFIAVQPEELNESIYLPSSRSLAFTRIAWEKAGKYPESLQTCEDLVFAQHLKNKGLMKIKPKAVVYWQMPHGLFQYFKQVAGYARGDVEAHYWPHLKKHSLVWLRYALFIALPWLLLFYPAYPLIKHKSRIKTAAEGALTVAIQLVSDIAVMWGGLQGWLMLLKKRQS